MDLKELVEKLLADGDVEATLRNPRAMFGRPRKQYVGATVLPEVLQEQNAYTEEDVRYRTTIANSGTRYSPAQIKDSGVLAGTVEVRLWESDIARPFTSRDLEAVQRLLRRDLSNDAAMRFLDWFDTTVNLALIELNEIQRWQAIIDAKVERRGDHGYATTEYYPKPAGHRVVAGGTWSSNAYDPYPDIAAGVDFLRGKGYRANRIITGGDVTRILQSNTNIVSRAAATPIVVRPGGSIEQINPSRTSLDQMNTMFGLDEIPGLERYDEKYSTQVGTSFFFPRGTMVILAETGRDAEIEPLEEEEMILVPNTIGYVGVGVAVGQTGPGRAGYLEAFTNKPPRIEAEGWQTAAPVILDPEAIYVISGIA